MMPKDYDQICAGIDRLGFYNHRQTVPDLALRHVFIKNPDAILVELNFTEN